MGRQQDLRDRAKEVGLFVTTRGGLGGPMRYRFSYDDISYFGTDGIFTALGLKEAEVWFMGFEQGHMRGRRDE